MRATPRAIPSASRAEKWRRRSSRCWRVKVQGMLASASAAATAALSAGERLPVSVAGGAPRRRVKAQV